MELLGLFTSALLSATILPGTSEAVLVGYIALSQLPVALLVAVATLGNVLGSFVNWLLGYYARSLENRPWFPVKPAEMARWQAFYERYGRLSLLLAWVPVIGDPITLVAGVARTPIWVFLPLVALSKLGRYVVVAAVAGQVF